MCSSLNPLVAGPFSHSMHAGNQCGLVGWLSGREGGRGEDGGRDRGMGGGGGGGIEEEGEG